MLSGEVHRLWYLETYFVSSLRKQGEKKIKMINWKESKMSLSTAEYKSQQETNQYKISPKARNVPD